MKSRTIALLWVMASGMVVAQMSPSGAVGTAKGVRTQLTGQAAAGTKPAAAPVKAASPLAPKAAKPAARKAAKPVAHKAARPAAGGVKKAAIKTAASSSSSKRDPFTSPIREQGVAGPNCSVGKKCLAINAILLRGIVKSQGGMIAVVESSTRRISYFLRENDPIFNGYVVKITPDTVVFRENVLDRVGKQSSRDVVMKVVAPVV